VVGVGLAVGLAFADAIGRRLADGLGLAVLEQATMATSKNKVEPTRARRSIRTLSSQSNYLRAALPSRQAPFPGPAYPAA
jgi:hypothetical protein